MLTHQLIIGQTLSGKSTAAKRIATAIRGNRTPVIVHDPTAKHAGPSVNGWPADYVFTDWPSFQAAFWASRGCYCIVDEASEVFDQDRNGARSMMQRGRHNGHVIALIAQRHKRLDKTAREQCSQLFAFVVDRTDAAELAEDWNDDSLLILPNLPPLHYVFKRRHQPAIKSKIIF